jgi:hypothetical protein
MVATTQGCDVENWTEEYWRRRARESQDFAALLYEQARTLADNVQPPHRVASRQKIAHEEHQIAMRRMEFAAEERQRREVSQ